MENNQKVLSVKGIKIDKLSIVAFFFYEKSAKINAYVETASNPKSVPICFDIERKEDVWDLLLFCPNWEKILELNDVDFQRTINHAEAYQHRILQPKNNDVITLHFFPIVIEDIYLDWESKKNDGGTMEILLTNFYKP